MKIKHLIFFCISFISLFFSVLSYSFEFNFAEGFNDQPVYYGSALSINSIDSDSRFSVSDLEVSSDFDDNQIGGELFIGIPYDENFAVEFGMVYFGTFDFSGSVDGGNIGELSGNQTLYGFSSKVSYQRPFEYFVGKAFLGAVLLRTETEGEIDLIGKDAQKLDDIENSGNLVLGFEALKEVKDDWHVGGGLSLINASDPIQSFSIRLLRFVND